MIYFILNTETGRTKIGFTDRDPKERLQEHQTGSDAPLKLLGCVHGGRAVESFYHHRFRKQRGSVGEWFIIPVRQIMEIIEVNRFKEIQEQQKILSLVDESESVESVEPTESEPLIFSIIVQAEDSRRAA